MEYHSYKTDLADDGRHSEVSFHSNIEHAQATLHGQVVGQDANNMAFEFRQPIQDPSTHFLGNKTPMEGFLTNSEHPYVPGFTGAGPIDGYLRNPAQNFSELAHCGAFGKPISEGGHPQSDSGYQTGSAGQLSRNSHEYLQTDYSFHLGNTQDISGQLQTSTKTKSSRGRSENIKCPTCAKVCATKSDYNKHERMHSKPFICYEQGCKRGREGFTTQNDLGRHVKSCHTNGIDGKSKSWQCTGKHCKDPSKVWPRFDNFKQHVLKMHPQEVPEDVIKRSEITPGVGKEADSNCEQVVNPANLSNQAMPAPSLSSQIFISPENPALANNFTPINNEEIRQTQPSASPAVTSAVKSGALPSPASILPSTSIDSKTPPSTTEEQPSSIDNEKMSHTDAPRPSSETENSGDELNILTSLLRNISSALETLNKSSSSTRRFELYGKIKSSVLRLPDDCAIRDGTSRRDPEAEGIDGAQQQCKFCNKYIKRSCDMRKHMKRHTRPYGCTWSNCYSSFGSKNDWKRHESTQHCDPDMWKCCAASEQPDQLFGICGQAFFRHDDFENHLIEEHNYGDEEASITAENSLISRNSHSRFWCGFCGMIHITEERGNLILNDRYTHIADHFIKEGKVIGDWVDAWAHKKKSDMQSAKDHSSGANSPDSHRGHPILASSSSRQSQQPMEYGTYLGPTASRSKKRVRSGDAEESAKSPKRIARIEYWTCCLCHNTNNARLSNCCIGCNHFQCPACKYEQH